MVEGVECASEILHEGTIPYVRGFLMISYLTEAHVLTLSWWSQNLIEGWITVSAT